MIANHIGLAMHLPAPPLVGRMGVDIFFVISGYVITRGLRAELDQRGRISLAAFYLRRAFRIMPPLLAYVGAVLGLVAVGVLPFAGTIDIARALTFTCNFGGCGGWWGLHVWTLSFEEQFYLIVPILFVLFGHRLGAFSLVIPLAWFTISTFGLLAGHATLFWLFNFIPISTGVWWAWNEERVLALARMVPVSIALVALVGFEFLIQSTLLHPLWITGVSAAIVIMLARSSFLDARVILLLSGPTLVAYGRVSYGLYLWQELATAPGLSVFLYPVAVAACIAGCFASYRWLEEPLIAVGRRLSEKFRQRTASDQPVGGIASSSTSSIAE